MAGAEGAGRSGAVPDCGEEGYEGLSSYQGRSGSWDITQRTKKMGNVSRT